MDIQSSQRSFRTRQPSRIGRGIDALTKPFSRRIASVLPMDALIKSLKSLDKSWSSRDLITIDHDTSDLQAATDAAKRVEISARTLNAASGAGAGLGSVLTIGADISATLALAMSNISNTGRAYGFDENTLPEQAFRFRILELAICDEPARRHAIIRELEEVIDTDGSLLAEPHNSAEPVVDQLVERIIRAASLGLLQKRAGALVPIVGTIAGAAINNAFQQDVSKAARFAFQERALRASDRT